MWLAILLALATAPAQALRTGEISAVTCAADGSQSYSLYLPTAYTHDRAWPLILAFDPGGRGRVPVERYQTAAERYGYIVVGSNNSRNGSTETSKIIATLTTDVISRFQIDPKRVYTAGMSGGARVAFAVALSSRAIAGVIASSAGYPDGQFRKTLPFAVFGTAGTEDFNHLEMRLLDRALTTPHHLTVFEGGHTWLSSDLALEAVEWMEIQAMKSGLSARDQRRVDEIFAKRIAAAEHAAGSKASYVAWQSIANDFRELKDVAAIADRAAAMAKDKDVREALKQDRDEDDREQRLLEQVRTAEVQLASSDERAGALMQLRQQWKTLSEKAKAQADSPERRFARRVLSGLSAGATTTDADYLKIISEYRLGRGGR